MYQTAKIPFYYSIYSLLSIQRYSLRHRSNTMQAKMLPKRANRSKVEFCVYKVEKGEEKICICCERSDATKCPDEETALKLYHVKPCNAARLLLKVPWAHRGTWLLWLSTPVWHCSAQETAVLASEKSCYFLVFHSGQSPLWFCNKFVFCLVLGFFLVGCFFTHLWVLTSALLIQDAALVLCFMQSKLQLNSDKITWVNMV